MLPYINLFGFEIASYGLIIFIGLFIGSILSITYFSKFFDIKKEDIFFAILYAMIGVGIGAKLLYLITNIPFLIQNFNTLNLWDTFLQMLKGGFVFYGGLIGGVLGVYIFSKQFKISFKSLALILFPVIPLVHAIGRIGCLCAGCCYGMEYHGFGAITFHNSLLAPNNIPLFPMQIVEALCNFIIFLILFGTYKKFLGTYKTIGLYCVLYGIVRFILEFFRGDLIRGIYFSLSTSQWVSIVIIIIGTLLLWTKGTLHFVHKQNSKNKI